MTVIGAQAATSALGRIAGMVPVSVGLRPASPRHELRDERPDHAEPPPMIMHGPTPMVTRPIGSNQVPIAAPTR